MASTLGDVLVVGEALVDLTRHPSGNETAHPGGSPLNVAVGLARLGVSTTLAAQVGDDDYGELLREHVDASDVDLRSLPPHRDETGVALATLDGDGQATYTFDLSWNPSEMPDPADFDLLHVGSIGAVLAPGADAVERLVAAAVAAGVPVSFDPNVRLAVTPDADDVRARVDRIVAQSTIAKLSDADTEALWPGLDPRAYIKQLAEIGPRLVALTCGGEGAVLVSGSQTIEASPPAITVADTIGAGDSFMAALLAGIATRTGIPAGSYDREAVAWLADLAVTASAITCSRPGADPPWRREVPALS